MSINEATLKLTAEEIQKQMRQARRELGVGVADIAEKARVMTDWKYYVRTNPWLCLGAAATLGYLLVPQKFHISQSSLEPIVELSKATREVAEAAKPTASASPSVFSVLLGMFGTTLLQGGMALASQQLNNYLTPSSTVYNGNGNGHDSTFKREPRS